MKTIVTLAVLSIGLISFSLTSAIKSDVAPTKNAQENVVKEKETKKKLNKHGVEIHDCCGKTSCCGVMDCCDISEKNKDDICKNKKCPKINKPAKNSK